ncbi:MAG: hypothetical protein ACREQ2_17700 [Candidatus Binatia bacterium]
MSFDFNKQDEQYSFVAAKARRGDYDVLAERPNELFETLRALLAAE